MNTKLRPFLAGLIALMFLAAPCLAQRDGGGSHGDSRDGGGDRGSNVDGRGSSGNDRGEIFGDQGTLGDLHDRIDGAQGLSEADKERAHRTVDSVKSEMDKVREANALVDKLRSQGLVTDDPIENARIEAEVKKQVTRIEEGRSSLRQIKRDLEAEIDSSGDLTREQKEEVRSILRDFADKRITETQARLALNRLLGGGYGDGAGFVLIVVLFILLVIVGAGFG